MLHRASGWEKGFGRDRLLFCHCNGLTWLCERITLFPLYMTALWTMILYPRLFLSGLRSCQHR